jgi:hypothetical protein
VEADYDTSTVALRIVQDDENGTRCLGVYLGHPATGEHKYRNRVLQVGVLTQGWRPCSVKKLLLRNPKKWKPDQIWQNLLRKAMAQRGLFCQWWGWFTITCFGLSAIIRNWKFTISSTATSLHWPVFTFDVFCIVGLLPWSIMLPIQIFYNWISLK